ncbi:kinase-like protein [Exidia glandulosa HHB12029]|uniref:Kinase-like protein n=1 Tax=Exidia glandulosa HHB12029 TaxID=1314781 RepID=A0A165DIX0_EXIGL|nr:kinase-like protein [Exidia glandulosa HHB12029]
MQELDRHTGKLRDIIVIEDTPPPATTGTPSTVNGGGGGGGPGQQTGYVPPIRTRAQAAAAAALNSAQPPPAKKRKREPADDAGPSSALKKPVVGNGLVKHWATDSVAATEDVRVDCHVPPDSSSSLTQHPQSASSVAVKGPPPYDDKEGHYIVTPDDLIDKRYRTVKLLGQGTFGKVVEALDLKTSNKVAIKIIRAVPKYRDASKIEIRVVQKLKERDPLNKHKCVHLLNWFDHRNHICLVFELLGMCVYDFLKDNEFAPFPRVHIQSFARQLLDSVAFLHDLHLIHTDLKPENILLVKNDYRMVPIVGASRTQPRQKRILVSTDIRLIDFGSATFQDEYHSTVVSTRHYRAPEIILALGWSYPCDAFSLGCILVEFYTGVALFQTHDNLEHLAMMEQVMGKMPEKFVRLGQRSKPEFFKPDVPKLDWPKPKASKQSKKEVKATRSLAEVIPATDTVNRHFLDLVKKLLTFDPVTRITVRETLAHAYLSTNITTDI